MNEIRFILFLFCGKLELKKKIADILKYNNPIEVINSEYIADSTHDAGLPEYDKITDQDRRKVRRTNSILRKLTTDKTNNFIIEIDDISNELISEYASAGKSVGYKLISLNIKELETKGGDKHFIFFQSPMFESFSVFFKRSADAAIITTPDSTSSTEEAEARYVAVTAALHTKSKLILGDLSVIKGDELNHFKVFGSRHGMNSLEIETGYIDVTKPTLLVNGKAFTIPKNAPQQTTVDVRSDIEPESVSYTQSETSFFGINYKRSLLYQIFTKKYWERDLEEQEDTPAKTANGKSLQELQEKARQLEKGEET